MTGMPGTVSIRLPALKPCPISTITTTKKIKMTKIFTSVFIAMMSAAYGQVIIGDAIGTATEKTSVLLEFAANQNRGLVLPYVRTLPANPAEGTLILDATNPVQARVKYFNGNWTDLSSQDADVSTAMTAQPTILQAPEAAEAKTIIGATTSTADGVLVLESTTKAMILPTVEDVQNIINPAAGMLVYVNKAGAKRLAVFNGSKWSYWRP